MEVIYSLIPSMIVVGLFLVIILVWAVKKGQYDDLDGDGNRILMDNDDGTKRKVDKRNFPDADD